MKFTVEIGLGNDAMKTTDDIAAALVATAEKVRTYALTPLRGEGGRVMDRNGNSVGKWRVGR